MLKKGLITIVSSVLLMSILTPFSISADTNGCSTEIITGRNNSQYCMPENIYNLGTETDKAKYRLMIRSGNVGANDSQWMEDWIVNRDNLRSSAMEKDLKGVVSNYYDRLKLYFKGVTNGTIHRQNSAILNYLLGSITGNQQNTNVWQAELNSLQQSNNRNYYTQSSGNNVYNTGDTSYYSFYNPDNRTFTYNNQTYNIVNNEYNFYTYESNYYTINNEITFNYVYNIDNSVVNVIQNGSTTTSTYYFKLPDGRNSYNLTEDDIKGLKVDINVSNYSVVSSSDILSGLYHFDGNKNNDVYNAQSLFTLSPNSVTYYENNNLFKQSLYIGARDSSSPNVINLSMPNTINSVDFRLYLSNIDDIYFNLKDSSNNVKYSYKSYKQQVTSNVVQRTNTYNIVSYSISGVPYNTAFAASCNSGQRIQHTMAQIGTTGQYTATWSCKIPIESTSYIPMMSNISVQEGDLADYLRPNEWNHIAIYAHKGASYCEIFINGKLAKYYGDTLNNLKFEIYGSGYALLDELRFRSGRFYLNNAQFEGGLNYIPPTTPYDSNIVYILPDSILTGSLLIQSNIPVNNYQIGGVRSSNPVKGDVFVLVNDVGFMQSLQQFDGADWVEKKGAIYNGNLGLWVSYYGYSVYTNNWDYTALSELSVDDIETQKDYYTWLGAQFNKIRNSIDSLLININNSVNNNDDLIQNITNDNDVDVNNNITNIIGNLKNRDNDIDLTGNNFNLKDGSDLNAFTPLVKETIDVFNDNGLGFLLLVPLLIAILGLVL